MRPKRFLRDAGPPAALLAGLVVLWEVWVAVADTPSYILPPPTDVVAAFASSWHQLPEHLTATVSEAVIGLVVGAIAGAAIAFAVHASAIVRRVLYPLLVGSQTIPIIVLAPLLVLWFGFGLTPKVIVVALIVFFPVAISTVAGLEGADGDLADLVRAMGASRRQVARHVLAPAAVPAFFAGLKIASAYAVAGAVIAEWVGAQSGLGIYITRSQASFRIDQVFVAIVLVALVSLVLFALVHLASRLASPWMYVTHEQEE